MNKIRILALATSLSVMGGMLLASPAIAAHVSCGQTITTSTTLDSDVGPCLSDGVIIGADNITLDLNGHRVFGLPTPSEVTGDEVGIRLPGRTGVQVKNGTVSDFDAGVAIEGGANNKISGVTATSNVGSGSANYGDGIALNGTSGNTLLQNTATRNGPFSGISGFGAGGADNNTINKNVITDNSNLSTSHHGLTEQTDGIRLENGSTGNTVVNNEVKRNGLDGIALFFMSANNTVKHNTVEGNGFHLQAHRKGDGIRLFAAASSSLVQDNSVFGNAANGIRVDSQNNQILTNQTGGNNGSPDPLNPAFDLHDSNPGATCDANVWSGNTFVTFFPVCTTL